MKMTQGHENGQILNLQILQLKVSSSSLSLRRALGDSTPVQHQHLLMHTITDSYIQHLDRSDHIAGGRAALHRLDETLFVPDDQANVCRSRNSEIAQVEKKAKTHTSGWLKRIKYILEWASIECASKYNLLHWKTGISVLKLLMESLKVWTFAPVGEAVSWVLGLQV